MARSHGAAAVARGDRRRRHVVTEQVLQALPALLDPDQRQRQVGDRVAHDVVLGVLGHAPAGRVRPSATA